MDDHGHVEEYEGLPGEPGYYALIIMLRRELEITTRGGKRFHLKPGLYVYIGSARGPGGIRARVARHLRRDKRLFWHIDYVTSSPEAEIIGVVSMRGAERDMESLLSRRLAELLEPIHGFGSTDKRDPAHLFYCGEASPDECIGLVEEEAYRLMASTEKKYRFKL